MIKYQFAYDSERNIININDLSKECKNKSDKFLCLSCENELVTVLGEKRRKHFRHKVITEINCSPETYLHKLAKLKFYEVYQNCLEKKQPFIIKIIMDRVCDFYEKDFLQTCKIPPRFFEFDLTQEFNNIYLEKRVDSFIPDILLTSSEDKKLFIEIAVTHKSELEKIKSNYQIIEFVINSEEDIQVIESCLLEESEKISFFNFNRLHKKGWCEGKCIEGMTHYAKEDALYNICVKFKNGEWILLQNQTLPKIETLNTDDILEIEYFSSLETYLCRTAKLKFYEVYQNCIDEQKPFLIKLKMYKICNFYEKEFLQTCQIGSDLFEYDLTKYFQKIHLEYDNNSSIPSVFLESKQKEKIYFEVTKNDEFSPEKSIYKNRIINFIIDRKDDIKVIESCIFNESKKIKFFKFNRFQKKPWCQGRCQGIYNAFIIFKNGKSTIFKDQTFEQIKNLNSSNNILNFELISSINISFYSMGLIYIIKVIESYQKGLKIKNCFLCRYHAINRSEYREESNRYEYREESIFCKFLKNTGNSNMATDCQYFKPDADVFSQYQNDYD